MLREFRIAAGVTRICLSTRGEQQERVCGLWTEDFGRYARCVLWRIELLWCGVCVKLVAPEEQIDMGRGAVRSIRPVGRTPGQAGAFVFACSLPENSLFSRIQTSLIHIIDQQ